MGMAGRWITSNGNRIYVDDNKSVGTSIRQHYKAKGKARVTKKQVAEVTHAINNDCNIYRANSAYVKGETYTKSYGNYKYTFVINDFDDYNFIRKKKIK